MYPARAPAVAEVMTFLLVALGAVAGAPLRYLTDRAVQSRHPSVLPWGTLVVNVVASGILGLVTEAAAQGHLSTVVVSLVGVGFCGALSSYSTFSFETLRLLEEREYFWFVCYVTISVLAGLGAAGVGWALGGMA